MNSSIAAQDRLIVALDVPTINEAKDLVRKLGSSVSFYKIGLELCMSGDYFELIEWLSEQNKKIFADLKLLDIPATVGKAVKNLSKYKIDFLTIHVSDKETMKAAVENKGNIKILAVTILTSLDEKGLSDVGFDDRYGINDLVVKRAKLAEECAIDGVIASGLEAAEIRNNLGKDFLIVTPGIRLDTDKKNDQKRTVDVKTAFANGADYIVVGRPITSASDPQKMAQKIIEIIKQIGILN
jgi:orotidine-5'-phosphate decarboxylase